MLHLSDLLYALLAILVLSLATASVSMTLTKAKIFKAPRDWIKNRGKRLGKVGKYISELATCPYCMSHWWAAAGVVYCKTLIFGGRLWIVVDLAISTFAVITLSSFACGLIFKAFAQMESNGGEEEGNE